MSTSTVRLGLDGVLKIGGIERTNVKNCTLNLTKETADVTTRANNGWKAMVPTLKEAKIDVECVVAKGDTTIGLLKDSFLNNTVLDVVFLMADDDGGLSAKMQCTAFPIDQPLTEAQTVKATLEIAYDPENPPAWIDGSGSGSV